jgi:kumamolisin
MAEGDKESKAGAPTRVNRAHIANFQATKDRVHPYLTAHTPSAQSWKVKDICEAYEWPRNLEGGGTIGIIELGGGYVQSDISKYFGNAGLAAPQVFDVSVDGTINSPSATPNSADLEVAADIQIAGASYAVATGKAATIRIYWSRDITVAIRRAAFDGCDVCCIAWGADEAIWGMSAALALEQAAIEATAAGMTIFAASGDNDSSDGGLGASNVDLPASAPHIIGCGGTTKTRKSEIVWNSAAGRTIGKGTGGGYSRFFMPMPPWQAGAPHGPGRMVPDVAANADPNTGYEIVFDGSSEVAGGTSTAAALYAGLFAAFGSKLGFITRELYLHSTCFKDITSGDNGSQHARVGPDPCTGIGSPIGTRLAALFADPAATARRQLREAQEEIRRLVATIAGMNPTPALGLSGLTPRIAPASSVIHPGDVYRGPWQDQNGNWWIQYYDAHLQPGPVQPA